MKGYSASIRLTAGRQPSQETGIYLRRHRHTWREAGRHRWPNGDVDPTFRCTTCGDVICCAAAARTELDERESDS